MSPFLRPDEWVAFLPEPLILDMARRAGEGGFTVDDLRLEGLLIPNVGARLGRLCSSGVLRVIGEENARTRSSKGRKVRRFVLTVAEGIA
jgi:hypothetical protein